jgi:hypothetical protein
VQEIVHKFLTREQTYSQLLMAVSDNERKIDNLRRENEHWREKLHELQMLQAAIDKSGLNKKFSYGKFTTTAYPNPENIPNPNTGTNTPGWLNQADLLNALAPYITPRSDTFVIRSMGEAKDSQGKVLARVRMEAVVQRVPDFIDPADDPATEIASLQSQVNKTFGRRFEIISVKEISAETLL